MESRPPFEIKVPNFESNIPDYLLHDATAQERYMMENLSVLNQKTDWQTGEILSGGKAIERVEQQVKIANGRTDKNEKAIEATVPRLDMIDKDLETVRFLNKWGKNKYVWVLLVVLIFVGIPYIASLGLTFKSFVGIFTFLFG